MEIIIAKTAGFCFGVSKAVRLIYELLDNASEQIYTIGSIIHNEQVVNHLKLKGVKVVEQVKDIDTAGNVVIRAHGVTPDIYKEIEDKNLEITDATCPYVKKIHKLVKGKFEEGYQIVIVGDKDHPEVIGINGWCNNTAYIIDVVEDVDGLPLDNRKICTVAQTTITNGKWEEINDYLEKKFKNIIKFDTICNATSARQSEAEDIAKTVDMMFVLGSNNSSNTQKLYGICKKYCSETHKIEKSGDLPPVNIKKIKKIGITAGASTPEWVIKEVIEKMSELNKQDNEMSFKDAFESSLVKLQTGDIVKGKIIGFNNAEVFVDMGFKSDGIISIEEFTDNPDFKPETSLKIGEEVEVFVIRVNDGEGTVLLSKKKVDSIKGWDDIEASFENKTPIKARITEIVNGGVIAVSNGIRIFIPASQISDRFVKELNGFLKQVVNVRIVDYNKQKRKIVGSAKVILIEERNRLSEQIWSNIEVGKNYSGIVKSLTDFGAFVDIGGVDGLIHVSELSWTKIKHPSEVLKVGDQVEVSILEFNKEKSRISLGYKKEKDNPWFKAAEKYKAGDIVKGEVVRFVPFGAFVELEKGVDALVHISQISNTRIGKPSDVLEIGQIIEAKVIELNIEARKISLSIKEVNPIESTSTEKSEAGEPAHKEELPNTIGDAINGSKGE